jgi:hypothetical protein
MELSRALRKKVKRRVQAQTTHVHIAAINLIRRHYSGDGVFLAVMLSLTCVLIVSCAISMR